MKKRYVYIIVMLLFSLILIGSLYTYKIDNKENYILQLEEQNIKLDEQKVVSFKAPTNNLNKIKFEFNYDKVKVDKFTIDITIKENGNTIKHDKISDKDIDYYGKYIVNISKIKKSNGKNYSIEISSNINNIEVKNIDILFYSKLHNILYICLIIVFLSITLIIVSFLVKTKNIKIETWFLFMSIVIYGLYILIFPLFTNHDEFYHWGRAYEISEGHLLSDKVDGYPLTKLPSSTVEVYNKDFKDIKYKSTMNSRNVKTQKDKTIMFDMKTVSVYSPVQYIPQTLGILIAKVFTNRPLIMAYFGRIMNAIISIILIYFSIKIIPFGKRILFTLAFIPIAIEGFTSLSADAITVSISMLFIAYILNIKYDKKTKKIQKKHFISILIMSSIISLCKIVYIPLIFLVLLIPNNKFNSKKDNILFKTTIILISIILNMTWLGIASSYLTAVKTADIQMASILKNPFNYIKIFTYTILSENQLYIYTLFGYNLGWGESIHPYSIIPFAFLLILIINSISDNNIKNKIDTFSTWIITLIFISIIGLIYTSLYIQFTPPGYRIILGVQGRYFLPVLPLIMMIVSKIGFEYKGNLDLNKVTIIVCWLLNISVLLTLFERFI